MNEGLYIKQAEIHGMSQRGGSVESSLRISSQPIYCDLIAEGKFDEITALTKEAVELVKRIRA